MNLHFKERLLSSLPERKIFALARFARSFGTDFYGSLHEAAEYCGMKKPPFVPRGMWLHGVYYPWWLISRSYVTNLCPISAPCWVARQDEASFLLRKGQRLARAIGMPFIYARCAPVERIPGSLLVMPAHSGDDYRPQSDTRDYISQILAIKGRFSFVAACVSSACIRNGLWVDEFKNAGIHVIEGAMNHDANSLLRMKTLLLHFEFVTSNDLGSCHAYAASLGCKPSIWGTSVRHPPLSDVAMLEEIRKDGTALPFGEEWNEKGRSHLPTMFVHPWEAQDHSKWGNAVIGSENKLSKEELRRTFRWTPPFILVARLRQFFRKQRANFRSP